LSERRRRSSGAAHKVVLIKRPLSYYKPYAINMGMPKPNANPVQAKQLHCYHSLLTMSNHCQRRLKSRKAFDVDTPKDEFVMLVNCPYQENTKMKFPGKFSFEIGVASEKQSPPCEEQLKSGQSSKENRTAKILRRHCEIYSQRKVPLSPRATASTTPAGRLKGLTNQSFLTTCLPT